MLKSVLSSVVLICVLACSTYAAEANIEDDLSGFSEEVYDDLDGFSDEANEDLLGFSDDDGSVEAQEEVDTQGPSDLTLSGNIAFKTSVGYHKHEVDGSDYTGVNQAQTALYLQLDGRLSDDWKLRISGDAFYDAIYDLRLYEDYRQEVLDDYRTQLRLDDTYIQGRLTPDLDLKAGRQVVVWGKSDNIRITDVINPLDNRLPGMTDIEDLRLSLGMAKFDYYIGQWNLSAMIIPENRVMMEATPRGEFFPVDTVFNVPGGIVDPFPELITPSTSWDNIQYAFAANGVFRGWDLSFYAADVLDQKWHFIENPRPNTPLSDRTVSKIKMLGSAVNVSEGSWLLKAEAAFLDGVRYNNTPDEKQRLDALIGFEYMGFTNTTLSIELANRHIFDHEARMQAQADFVDKDEVQTALRATRSFLNDTIDLTALVSMFGEKWEYGGFARVWMEYELMQAVNVNLGVVDYIGGERPFMESIKDNDRVFADIQYSF
jgi:hypothetical protein